MDKSCKYTSCADCGCDIKVDHPVVTCPSCRKHYCENCTESIYRFELECNGTKCRNLEGYSDEFEVSLYDFQNPPKRKKSKPQQSKTEGACRCSKRIVNLRARMVPKEPYDKFVWVCGGCLHLELPDDETMQIIEFMLPDSSFSSAEEVLEEFYSL